MQTDMSPLPVRGNDAVEILLNDHTVIRDMLSRLTQATESQQRQQVMEQLKGALTIHNATEENLVYPALREVARKKAESEHLYQETAEADVLVFKLDTMLKEGDDANFGRTAQKLQDAILEHMDDEENKAFPHLQKGTEPEQSQMLADSVREFRSTIRMSSPGARTETGEISQQGVTSKSPRTSD